MLLSLSSLFVLLLLVVLFLYIYIYVYTGAPASGCFEVPVPEQIALAKKRGFFGEEKRPLW